MGQGLFFNKVAGVKPIKKETLEQVHSSCKFCQISKNTSGRLLPLKRRLVGGGISISFCYQWEWVNQFVIREDRNVAISGGKIILRSCKAKKKTLFSENAGGLNFFYQFSGDILFSSLVSFAFFCIVFGLFAWFLKLKIYILIHIRLYGQVSDKKNFTQHHMIIITTLLLSLTGEYFVILKYRNSHRRCSVRKGVLKNFANFTGNTCARLSFLIKLQACNFI